MAAQGNGPSWLGNGPPRLGNGRWRLRGTGRRGSENSRRDSGTAPP
ncbi:hypothetical protein STTU_0882 [Streptomyces sp. Tu6071]|nr:hypothetical protein STTU_0882 [Streptomyces sp. Tu6071]